MRRLKGDEIPESIEPWRVVAAYWSGPFYSEEREVLVDLGEVDEYGDVVYPRYVIIEHSHCSCYDFPESEPEAVEYTEEELIALAKSKMCCGTYYRSEEDFWRCVLHAFDWEV